MVLWKYEEKPLTIKTSNGQKHYTTFEQKREYVINTHSTTRKEI